MQEEFDIGESRCRTPTRCLTTAVGGDSARSPSQPRHSSQSWRLYADELDFRAGQANVRALEEALSASGLDSIFNEKRAQAAIQTDRRR